MQFLQIFLQPASTVSSRELSHLVQKILDELAEEENRKSKIPLPAGINPDQLSNDFDADFYFEGDIETFDLDADNRTGAFFDSRQWFI